MSLENHSGIPRPETVRREELRCYDSLATQLHSHRVSLKKWMRNPFAVMAGAIQGIFWLALFGNSFNLSNVFASSLGGKTSTFVQQTFGGAPNYITFLAPGIICLVSLMSMSYMGVDMVFDRINGYIDEVSSYPIPALIYLLWRRASKHRQVNGAGANHIRACSDCAGWDETCAGVWHCEPSGLLSRNHIIDRNILDILRRPCYLGEECRQASLPSSISWHYR